eukprot:gnl/TRDRNA2_/TRDRNA2_174129_c1_seq13.p1 gnl/TRDRNA2_/TRDRNA2_174129_c1~~gnl/TRDRNA2_/TRDRNA2_174129_c1_seq13.p1  ORF type:complete len:920 (+),score=189.13 gnl/TRDRNA2_/TRDRNA2_174129_c1_seq13:187-2760(+)
MTPVQGAAEERFLSPPGHFQAVTDHASMNKALHQSTRPNTFNTPSPLHRPCTTASGNYNLYCLGETKDLAEICEEGFAKSMKKLSRQIMADFTNEFRKAIPNHIANAMEVREATANIHLMQIRDMLQEMQSSHAAARVDFSPIIDEIRDGGALSLQGTKDSMHRLESQLVQGLAQVQEEVLAVRKEQDEARARSSELSQLRQSMRRVEDAVKHSEVQFMKELGEQQSNVKVLTEMASQSRRQEETFQHEMRLIEQIVTTTREGVISEESLMFALSPLKRLQRTVELDLTQVLAEVGRLQQAMNLHFVPWKVAGEDRATRIQREKTEVRDEARQNRFGRKLGLGLDDGADALECIAANQVSEKVYAREWGSQTEVAQMVENCAQTDHTGNIAKGKAAGGFLQPKGKKETQVRVPPRKPPKPVRRVFADSENLKKKAQEHLIQRVSVSNYYKSDGFLQKLVKNAYFEQCTLIMIALNAIWIAVDTDNNQADVLRDADLIFQVVENLFCIYFTFEILVRLCAFEKKRNCVKDPWFVFDAALVGMMIVETWIITIALLIFDVGSIGVLGNLSMLRMARMVKMLRMTRMARLLRAVPELMVLVKGIAIAARSVFFFFLLIMIIVYVFAIVCRITTKDSQMGDRYFTTVPVAMNALLIDLVLPMNNVAILNEVNQMMPALWPLLMIFVLLTSITIMYMLIGVLVNVVNVVSRTEKEMMTISAVNYDLREAFSNLRIDVNHPISKESYQELLMSPKIFGIVQAVGVDVINLVEMADMIYEEVDPSQGGLSFVEFVGIVLSMRGTNPVTVKDVKEHLRVIKNVVKDTVKDAVAQISEELSQLQTDMQEQQRLLELKLEDELEDIE